MYRPYTMRGSLYLSPEQPEEWLMNDLLREDFKQPDVTSASEFTSARHAPYRALVLGLLFVLLLLIPIGGVFAALSIAG